MTLPRARAGREDLVISLTLAGKSPGQICSIVSISRSTLLRLRKRPTFQARFEAAKSAAFEGAVNCLHDSAVTFARTLRDVCKDPRSKDSAKATAARSGLDTLFRATELFAIEERLKRLEAAAEAEKK